VIANIAKKEKEDVVLCVYNRGGEESTRAHYLTGKDKGR